MKIRPSGDQPTLALTELYHGWLTGLVLATALHEGADAAGRMMFLVYRRHHENRFLASFDKLGLTGLPHAVACARYHCLSNQIGGVSVECVEQSDRKAWVRFAYPRWIYEGAALCGVPRSVSRGMLEGWYARNGVSLRNPRLAFVCTSEDMGDGYGLAGYFVERDEPVPDDQRLCFAFDEHPPPFDPAAAPRLDPAVWPVERLVKARLNYSVEPLRLALIAMAELFGEARAEGIAGRAARIIGLQSHESASAAVGIAGGGARGYARLHAALGARHGDAFDIEAGGGAAILTQRGWKFGRGLGERQAYVARCWAELWKGLAISHDRQLRLEPESLPRDAGDAFTWRVGER